MLAYASELGAVLVTGDITHFYQYMSWEERSQPSVLALWEWPNGTTGGSLLVQAVRAALADSDWAAQLQAGALGLIGYPPSLRYIERHPLERLSWSRVKALYWNRRKGPYRDGEPVWDSTTQRIHADGWAWRHRLALHDTGLLEEAEPPLWGGAECSAWRAPMLRSGFSPLESDHGS